MGSELEDAGSWLLQILYDNYDKPVNSSSISKVLEVDEATVVEGLNELIKAQLVEKDEAGYRLSEKGYAVSVQRATSYCPHL